MTPAEVAAEVECTRRWTMRVAAYKRLIECVDEWLNAANVGIHKSVTTDLTDAERQHVEALFQRAHSAFNGLCGQVFRDMPPPPDLTRDGLLDLLSYSRNP